MTTQIVPAGEVAVQQAEPRREPGVGSLLRLEYLKTSRQLITKVVFGLAALFTGGALLVFYLIAKFSSSVDLIVEDYLIPNFYTDVISIMWFVGPILIAILAAGLAASDYGWGTIRTMVGSGANRTRILVAKLLLMAGASVALVITGIVSGLVVSLAVGLIEGQGIPTGWFDLATLGDMGAMLARASFVLTFVGVIAFAVSQITRSVAAGVATGIGVVMVFPILQLLVTGLGTFGKWIDSWLPSANFEVLEDLNTFGVPEPPAAGAPDPWQAVATLTLYGAIAVAIVLWRFNRRDVAVD